MKPILKDPSLPVDELKKDGVYITHANDLVQIKGIDKVKNELHVYNITESCNVYMVLSKHILIRKIR